MSEQSDPDAPPSPSAPGSAGLRPSPERGRSQFAEAYEDADPEVAAVGSIAHDDEETPPDGPPAG